MSKGRKKKVLWIVVLLVIGLVFGKDLVLKSVISAAAGKVTGADVTMQGFSLRLLKQSVTITGFKMYNPDGFPEGVMVDIPKMHVSLDVPAMIKGKLHIPLAEFELNKVVLTTNKDGKLNIQSLAMMQGEEEPKEKEAPKEKKPSKAMPFKIDELKIDIGKVVEEDYSAGEKPVISVHEINIKKTYTNITSPQQLALLIVSEPLKQTALRGAAVYGAAALAGAAVLPVGVAAVFVGKDSATVEVKVSFDEAVRVCKEVLVEMGELIREDADAGVLKAKVQGSDVTLKVASLESTTVQVTVSARKLLIPKPKIAGGVIHAISERLPAP